jgi:8-oxo-dGTP pyrophosphatase MutT (NUDIX family)
MTRSLFPGKWECGGGQLRHGEGFFAALQRQFFEEFGLQVQPKYVLEVYEIHVATAQRIIPGVRFLCEAREGEVHLNKAEFSEYRWLELPVTEQLDWIGGIKEVLDIVASSFGAASTESPSLRTIGFRSEQADVRDNGDDAG